MRNVLFLFVFLVIIIVPSWFIFHTFSQGEFTNGHYSKTINPLGEENEEIYVGCQMEWTGKGKPLIKDIYFIKEDGSIVKPDQGKPLYTPLIEETSNDSNTLPVTVRRDTIYVPAKNYKVKSQQFNLVFKVSLENFESKDEIKKMKIKYKILGVEKEQTLSIPAILSNSTEADSSRT